MKQGELYQDEQHYPADLHSQSQWRQPRAERFRQKVVAILEAFKPMRQGEKKIKMVAGPEKKKKKSRVNGWHFLASYEV
jgi:hypothetical protein